MAKKRNVGPKHIDKHGYPIKIGDKVRMTGAPSGLRDEEDMLTKTVFDRCVGRMFTIRDFDEDRVELRVGRVMGQKSYTEWIYIEPEFVELVWSKPDSRAKRGGGPQKRKRVLK